MTPERWQEVKDIFHAALEREAGQRSAFLSEACGEDSSLRQEVESLISSHEQDGSFIDSPAYEVAAEMLAHDERELEPGRKLGSYRIISLLGRGGMGEVYLGQDTRLGRRVALKLLPGEFTKDADRLRRFEQEARTASALNHPNILTIYEIGESEGRLFFATEFIDGETLRQRMKRRRMSVSEAIDTSVQIAGALAAAHRAGIIHRDIKPENVMVRRDDRIVKVLDFGLAKLTERKEVGRDTQAPTLARVDTSPGMIIGTANYMSPEQARGLKVDERTDIFSLGAVIYEMIAGRGAFDGETPSDVISLILQKEPQPLARSAPGVPSELARIVTKALRKDREERYQVVKDLLLDLKSLKEELEFQARLEQSSGPDASEKMATLLISEERDKGVATDAAVQTDVIEGANTTTSIWPTLSLMKSGRRWPVLALVSIMVIGLSFGLYKFLGRNQPKASSNQNAATQAPSVANISRVTVWSGLDTQPTLSPDGNSVAYSSNHDGSFEIYVKQLTPGGREIQLTADGQENFQPAWSPDGQRIAYYSKNHGGVWVVPTLGGTARQLTDFGSSPKWSHDGSMIVFQSDANPDLGGGSVGSSTLWIVPAQG
ncbi:MAG TPA: protein kinase, partial [Pyrinomonadaceae bacterium]|nr:protein kinase [Pyrinomonadaceae bacterium]